MPAPVAGSNLKTWIAAIGPGLVMIGGTIGTGEWVIGSGVAWLYQGALLWVAPLAVLCQVMLNTEVMRYTLVTGEPMFTGFMRSKPGPIFWLSCYLFLDILSWMPALAGLASQILIFTFTQQPPTEMQVKVVSCGILLTCAILLCFGGKIYNTLEVVLGGKVLFVLFYLTFVTLFFVPWEAWSKVLQGMSNPFYSPEGVKKSIDWVHIGAIAGLAGIGGMGNILASNYVREKGWGMGSKVGAIASAFGGHEISLSHIGTIARPTADAVARFQMWWRRILRDQFGLWMWGSIIGMLLPCVLGVGYLQSNYFQNKGTGDFDAAIGMARDFGAVHGPVFMSLTLLCGFVILFPGQFSSMDGIARRWCDAIWSGSARARASKPDRVRFIYYGFVSLYVTIGLIVNVLGVNPRDMMQFNANLANLAITCCILHTLYVNTHFLPVEFRPSMAKRACLILAAIFYTCIFSLVTWQKIQQGMRGELFSKPKPAVTAPAPPANAPAP
jgi:hypothetical protein